MRLNQKQFKKAVDTAGTIAGFALVLGAALNTYPLLFACSGASLLAYSLISGAVDEATPANNWHGTLGGSAAFIAKRYGFFADEQPLLAEDPNAGNAAQMV